MTEVMKKNLFNYGSIIFGVGLLIILISSFFVGYDQKENMQIIVGTLIILGSIVGVLNIAKNQTRDFLVSSLVIIFVLSPIITIQTGNGVFNISIMQYIVQIFYNDKSLYDFFLTFILYFMAFIIPPVVIVSLKNLFFIAKN
ncbi:MAG: hypothetical protein PF569_09565 [Candidatus Woesearchaeota archaeon]|jgi:hydroxyethylthiazole kinase-like sugar kinase family protein|nr:hypothetical protein [Candidatus Woesearchaeota archaeon]